MDVVLNDQNVRFVCRACLRRETDDMFSMYDEMEHKTDRECEKTLICDLLTDVAATKFETNKPMFPMLICINCVRFLQMVLDFRYNCRKSQAVLSKFLLKRTTDSSRKATDDWKPERRCSVQNDFKDAVSDSDTLHSELLACSPKDAQTTEDSLNKAEQRDRLADDSKKPFKCPLCHRRILLEINYVKHMNKHRNENRTCNVCDKTFTCLKLLNGHLKTHEGERRYSCKVCGKRYKQSSSVTAHMRIHTGQRPYLCSICGRGFRQNPDLKYHMRTHTKEKPYMCNVCGKTMSMQCHFVTHMRTHTGEKPFQCSDCNKAFPSSTRLKRHSIIHTGLKPFTCDVCKKSFNRKSTLLIHAKIHTNDRPHSCHLCGKSFIQAHSLKLHLRNHSK